MQIALLLIALGFGYKIYTEASALGKKRSKRFGRILGIFIMVVSFSGTLCSAWTAIQCGSRAGSSFYCPVHDIAHGGSFGAKRGGKFFCPFTFKGLNPSGSTESSDQ